MQEKDPKELLRKVIEGSATDEERGLLESWYFNWRKDEPSGLTEQDHEAAKAAIYSRLPQPEAKQKKLIPWQKPAPNWPLGIAAAAVILLVAGAGLWFYTNTPSRVGDRRDLLNYVKNDIAPGKRGATLTLANGKKIRLADAANGEIAKEAGISVTKTADGQVVYETASSGDPSKIGMTNVLTTAKGETYMLILPDKSTVWLNAASSLTYAATLNERGRRRVKLEGEAYFQIAKDKAHPFVVESNGQQVEVLGTHFNINAYADEPAIKTTLLEGSVEVNENTILKPGQQAVLIGNNIKVQQVNAEDAIAWKNDLFVFDDEPLDVIMRRVERWYNVEIVYDKGVNRKELYGGSVSRYDNVSKVLEGLELTKGIHFKIEGRRITVMK